MLKIVLVSLVGFAALGWFVSNPDALFYGAKIPPTVRAEPGPIKHRPEGYVAVQNQPGAVRISSRQDRQDTLAIDVNLILAR